MRSEPRPVPLSEDPAQYRIPMAVTAFLVYKSRTSHYLCPRCRISLDREFTAFCDRCGQCLSWKNYRKAVPVLIQRE